MHFMNRGVCSAQLPYWEKPEYIRHPRINSIPLYHDSALTQLTQRAGRRVLPLRFLHSGLENTRRSSKCPQNGLSPKANLHVSRGRNVVAALLQNCQCFHPPSSLAISSCPYSPFGLLLAMLCGPPPPRSCACLYPA